MSFKRRDIFFIILIPVVCAVIFFINSITNSDGDTVKIYFDGELYKSMPLCVDSTTDINGTNTVVIENGTVYMSQASCPDKLCINQGKIKNSAKNIVCLPNKITVKVDKTSDVDTVSN